MNAFTKMVAYGTPKNFRVEQQFQPCINFFEAENLGVNVPARCNRCKSCRDCSFEAHQLSQIEQNELDEIRNSMTLDPIRNQWVTKYPYKVDPSILQDNKLSKLTLFFTRLRNASYVIKQLAIFIVLELSLIHI